MKINRILNIVEWCFSIFLLLMGFGLLFSYVATGIMLLLAGLILLPPLYNKLKNLLFKKTNYNTPWWQRAIVVCLFFALAIAFTPKTASTTNVDGNLALKAQTSSLSSNSLRSSSSSSSSKAVSSSAASEISTSSVTSSSVNGNITIDFIDVGQGDAELIRQGNQAMLIDTGPNSSESKFTAFLSSQGISEINYLVLTHPHEDHIGNAVGVLQKYKVDNLLMTQATTNTKTFENVLNAANVAKGKGMKVTNPSLGSAFNLGNAKCQVFGPVNPDSGDLNTCSIVLKITYGNTTFLFTGDAQTSNESGMLAKGYDLSADVLKVGHHGSKTSSSQAFLNAVHPKYTAIEVGKGNTYGHPTQVVLDRLAGIGAQVFRTDEMGTIVCTSDGSTIKFDKAVSPVKPQAPPESSAISQASDVSSAVTAPPQSSVQENVPQDNKSLIVYITKSGKKYHSEGCRSLSKSCIPITLGEAQAEGYTPCSVCNPPT